MKRKVGEIFETDELNMFSLKRGNREVKKSRFDKVKKSILKEGYIKAFPIVVNHNNEIEDGQARWMVCKELNIPITYTYVDDASTELCISINKSTTIWYVEDYVKHYADEGCEDYEILKRLSEKYSLKDELVAKILSGTKSLSPDNSTQKNKMKEGMFKIDRDIAEAEACLAFVSSFNDDFGKFGGKKIIKQVGLAWIYIEGNANIKRVGNCVKRIAGTYNKTTFCPGNVYVFLKKVEEFYNEGLRVENRKRFAQDYEDAMAISRRGRTRT